MKPLPPLEHCRECFSYDPDTGVLTWKDRPRSHFKTNNAYRSFIANWAGEPAGGPSYKGYLRLHLDGTRYFAHRIIWLMQTGSEPNPHIDHINRDKADNRWVNLREADPVINGQNRSRANNNTSGRTGVCREYGKWVARISLGGRIRLGVFTTKEEAIAARQAAELTLGYINQS